MSTKTQRVIHLLILNLNLCYIRSVVKGSHTNAGSVGNASGPMQASVDMRQVTLERDPTSVANVVCAFLIQVLSKGIITEATLQRNLTNVTSVGKPSFAIHTLESIRKFLG